MFKINHKIKWRFIRPPYPQQRRYDSGKEEGTFSMFQWNEETHAHGMIVWSSLRMWTASRKEEEEKQGDRILGRSMKYGKKESGHERKSPEGLAMLGVPGCRKYPAMR